MVDRAVRAGVAVLGVADHDSVNAVAAATQAGASAGVSVLPAIELSARQGDSDVHVLGYLVDPSSPVLRGYLKRLSAVRRRRAGLIIERLRSRGLDVSFEEVMREARRGRVGRAHIARVLVAKGHARSMADAFRRYLGSQGSCYVAKPAPGLSVVIAFLRDLGAVPVIAHPGLVHEELDMAALIQAGLGGLESVNPEHTPAQQAYWSRTARRLGLVATGGSDWHGESQTPHAGAFGRFFVDASVASEILARGGRPHRGVRAPVLPALGVDA